MFSHETSIAVFDTVFSLKQLSLCISNIRVYVLQQQSSNKLMRITVMWFSRSFRLRYIYVVVASPLRSNRCSLDLTRYENILFVHRVQKDCLMRVAICEQTAPAIR